MKKILLPLAAITVLAACASQPAPAAQSADTEASLGENVGDAAGSAYVQTRDGFTDAALSPLEDLNLRRDEIPPLLAGIDSPYDLPTNLTCRDISRLIGQLDAVLGPDWDTPDPDERLRTEVLADSASGAALNAIASEARGIIPFRSLVRKATGAESHEKKYHHAYKIGAQRRAYLKGMGLSKGCPLPARPDFEANVEESSIVFKGDSPHPAQPYYYNDYQAQQLQNLTPVGGSSDGISSQTTPPEDGREALQTDPRQ